MQVRLADHDRAGRSQTCRHGGILARHAVTFGVKTRTQSRRKSRYLEAILNRNRDAIEKRFDSVRKSPGQCVGFRAHFFSIERDIDVVACIAVRARESLFDSGSRRELSAGEPLAELLHRTAGSGLGHGPHFNRIHRAPTGGNSIPTGRSTKKREQRPRWPPFLLAWAGSELKTERHLNLPRTADGLVHDAQAERTIVKARGFIRRCHIQSAAQVSLPRARCCNTDVLRDVVDRDVESWAYWSG